jgi:cation transport ATPase
MTDTGVPGEDRSVVPGAVPNAEPPVVDPATAQSSQRHASERHDDAVSDAIQDDARASAHGKLGWLSITVAIVFGLFYVYAFFVAISDIVDWSISSNAPWGFLIAALLLPVVVFAAAFWVGLRRNIFGKALVFILGLVVVAALTITLNVFADATIPVAIPV